MIRRIFVEKKAGFDAVKRSKLREIENALSVKLIDMRMILRYDIEGIGYEDYSAAKTTIFSEPPVDMLYEENIDLSGYLTIGVEYLPGQYDQRADSAAQCVQLLTKKARPMIKTAIIYAFKGDVDYKSLVKYLVNPVEARLASLDKPETLDVSYDKPGPVPTVTGFTAMTGDELARYRSEMGFAMSRDDIEFVADHFRQEGRDPTVTELKVIDTYWSDHCRHTTFSTNLTSIEIETDMPELYEAYDLYLRLHHLRARNKKEKAPTLMDMATIGAWSLKNIGRLDNLDESDEINACTIRIKADIGGELRDWLVLFKNETHNHPTEIEPFGGAATCLGGAIRDPLSGRAYVYQSMRVTGAGDVSAPISQTLEGKLPQRTISKTAAAGFSSYGNQIGLATGQVFEMHHDGYVAKRLETGFVVGAAPVENVVREKPAAGDIVLIIGGETGRDGCGGATGSSKAHTLSSLETCGAEVQKGNPLTERKIQRLFRNPEATRLIKKCNDFGAGGVSVAVGELSDGLDIDLDALPKKYSGLNSTELAISESQERMAVVVRAGDADKMIEMCAAENLHAVPLAVITDLGRMRMTHEGRTVVDLSRAFLDTNGARLYAEAVVRDKASAFISEPVQKAKVSVEHGDYMQALKDSLSDYNVCLQKGMAEMFDSTIGAASVLMPFGGKHQLTPSISMAALLPVDGANTATISAFGCYPALLESSCFTGAVYSVLSSVAKVVATGASFKDIRLTFQEFFEKLGSDPGRWGKPASALLGALYAQLKLGLAAIGGKDSMSGSFENLDVPPTLISFALAPADASRVITNVLKPHMTVYKITLKRQRGLPDFDYAGRLLRKLSGETAKGNITYAQVVEDGGSAAAVVKSCFGNMCGFTFDHISEHDFANAIGDLLICCRDETAFEAFDIRPYGVSTDDGIVSLGGEDITISSLVAGASMPLEKIYPTTAQAAGNAESFVSDIKTVIIREHKIGVPKVFIPVFPGTNCEYDTARAFEKAGAETDIFVIKNRSAADIDESVEEIVKRLSGSQILMLPGGFSGGDEPDGSGKFIATTFRNPKIAEAVHALLYDRDGLALGICNGFQALIKMGLLPGGKITTLEADSPTLTFNNIARHISQIASVRVSSKLSPWLSEVNVGEVYGVAVSHGEGRFVAHEAGLKSLIANGQIATQYCDLEGSATMQSPYNPNGSMLAIEGITSADGRIYGKMGHIERAGAHLYKNIPFDFDMKVFESGVKYFK